MRYESQFGLQGESFINHKQKMIKSRTPAHIVKIKACTSLLFNINFIMFLCEFWEVGYPSLKLIFPQKILYHVITLHVVR